MILLAPHIQDSQKQFETCLTAKCSNYNEMIIKPTPREDNRAHLLNFN